MESYLGAGRALSCSTGITSNSQTSSKWCADTPRRAECFCLHMVWHTASSSQWWHPRKHIWGPSGSEQSLHIPGRLLSLLSAWACSLSPFLVFFPQKVWSSSPIVFWYVSCSLPKHAGSMTNEVGVKLAKIISLFLSLVAISILIHQTLPTLRPKGLF